MDTLDAIRVGIEPVDGKAFELACRIALTNQTEQEKYEIIKPVAEELNYYCDSHSIRFVEDCDFLAIKLKNIHFVHYEKETKMFMLTMKKSFNLHVLNINKKELTIYVYKEHHNFIVSCFLKFFGMIKWYYMKCKIKIQLYLYAYKLLYRDSQKDISK